MKKIIKIFPPKILTKNSSLQRIAITDSHVFHIKEMPMLFLLLVTVRSRMTE